jgi:hypothetical protein
LSHLPKRKQKRYVKNGPPGQIISLSPIAFLLQPRAKAQATAAQQQNQIYHSKKIK